MHNYVELILIVFILVVIAGPVGFVRYRLYLRYILSQESIAESLRALAEAEKNRR
jgi:hypothetical protein